MTKNISGIAVESDVILNSESLFEHNDLTMLSVFKQNDSSALSYFPSSVPKTVEPSETCPFFFFFYVEFDYKQPFFVVQTFVFNLQTVSINSDKNQNISYALPSINPIYKYL